MSFVREFINRLKYLLRRKQFDVELDQEIRFHVEHRAAELQLDGMPGIEAALCAQREFGSALRVREDSRGAWRFCWLEDFAGDLRHGIRIFRREPDVATAAILSLALGIGSNTAVFSIVKGALLGQLPVHDPARLVSFHRDGREARLSYPDFEDYRRNVTAFEDVAATYPAVPGSFSVNGEAERLWGELVTTNYFSVLGAEPRLGRGFLRKENSSAVVVISERLRRRKFNSDSEIIGATVRLRGDDYVVVGVAPRFFHGGLRGFSADFWIPLGLHRRVMPQLGQGARGPIEGARNYPWLFATAWPRKTEPAPECLPIHWPLGWTRRGDCWRRLR